MQSSNCQLFLQLNYPVVKVNHNRFDCLLFFLSLFFPPPTPSPLHCSKLHELEAQLCKVESKYMILLQETQQPRAGGCGCSRNVGVAKQPYVEVYIL